MSLLPSSSLETPIQIDQSSDLLKLKEGVLENEGILRDSQRANANQANTKCQYFLDCFFFFSTSTSIQKQQQQSLSQYEWIKNRLRRHMGLDGNLSKIVHSFDFPFFLKYKKAKNKLFISDQYIHIIRSISNIRMSNDHQWNAKLEIEVGQPEQEGYSNGDRHTCKLKYPSGFDWDMNDNMYICNSTCICKVDGKSNQVSLVAGLKNSIGYQDGNNHEAMFCMLTGILCYQQNHQSPLVLYACDFSNHCIRMIDVTNSKTTTTLAGKGQEQDDIDGTLRSTRFDYPWDIVKDDENDHILYVSDSGNHKIKMIDMKKGMMKTLVGDENDKSILDSPGQMQIIDSFIYVACHGFKDCIVKIDKHSKQVTKIKFNDGKEVSSYMHGIAYHELDQCFYINDQSNIYKLE